MNSIHPTPHKIKFNNLLTTKYSVHKILQNRLKFINYLEKVNILNKKILNLAFYYLLNTYLDINVNMSILFVYSMKETTKGGTFEVYKDMNDVYSYKLIISKYIMQSIFNKKDELLEVSGVPCKSKLECLVVLMEHEFIHFLIAYCDTPNWNGAGHTKNFKLLMKNLFNHSECTHDLLSSKDIKNIHNLEVKQIKNYVVVNMLYNIKKNDDKIKMARVIKKNPKTALIQDIKTSIKYKIVYSMFNIKF